ncbi:hypothetical protein M9H77_02934 [Catharanthus roseus]|uniref:Uncharacterized protein n=1 Tax=Catharanthus roseus TaxID=4058 RepID=A0ACC0C9U7_CATRO|nr:hypothetical protein M9H77_02934 [Catharanthus roseus]
MPSPLESLIILDENSKVELRSEIRWLHTNQSTLSFERQKTNLNMYGRAVEELLKPSVLALEMAKTRGEKSGQKLERITTSKEKRQKLFRGYEQ